MHSKRHSGRNLPVYVAASLVVCIQELEEGRQQLCYCMSKGVTKIESFISTRSCMPRKLRAAEGMFAAFKGSL